MPRLEKRLKAVRLKHLGVGLHHDGLNLYLQVTPAGNRSWLFRYYRSGKGRGMGLGPLHSVSLLEAREKALDCRKHLMAGQDPLAEKRALRRAARLAEASAFSFEEAAERYIAAHEAGWRNGGKSAGQWRASLSTYAYPLLGKLSVDAIDTALVMRVLEPIWKAKTETASRVRQRIEAVLDWAIAKGFRQGPNPAAWRGNINKLLPERKKAARVRHHPALPYRDMPAFMAELGTREGISARALEFTILNACRTGEAIYATWPEIDTGEAVWTVPGNRMKAGKAHRIPVSKAALATLARVPRIRGCDYVFAGGRAGKPLSNAAMHELLKGMRPGVTVHGMRSAFRDWAAEETSFANEVCEAALAHVVGDKAEAAYRRGDLFKKRRELMQAWARYCMGGKP